MLASTAEVLSAARRSADRARISLLVESQPGYGRILQQEVRHLPLRANVETDLDVGFFPDSSR